MNTSLDNAVIEATHHLARAGIAQPRLDARVLVEHVLEGGERQLENGQCEHLRRLVGRRRAREPLAHITGHREFWSLAFAVTRHTLIPRPDSETLVEAALAWPAPEGANVLDLGSGSGCLLAAVLSERPDWWGLGLDIESRALCVAGHNLNALGLGARARLVLGDWTDCLAGSFDVVLCNPPYVADPEWPDLEPEVADFEPRIALAGGADGLACYRRIVPRLGDLLNRGGAAFLEVGAGQAAAVAGLLRRHALDVVDIKEDLAGIPRCVVARRRMSRGK
ncbi:MAG: peptide chain release factor N(5)-glutamine methyltransferase [Rhodospirillales bacterium]|nr:peptide chain release factor N(5)-glutamine methyltransferase [Rhodospirillales bacterium]